MRTVLILLVFPLSVLAQTLGPFGNNMHTAQVFDAIVYNNLLFLGGSTGKINNVVTNGVAIYNGTTTTTLPGAGFTRAFAIHNNDLYMVGFYPNGEHVLKWDGTTLTPLGFPYGVNYLGDIISFNGSVYLCGQFEVGGVFYALAKYDGSSWSYTASLPNANESGYVMHIFNNQLYIGGAFTGINGNACNGIVAFNGNNWNNLLGGPSTIDSVFVRGLFISGSNLIAVGNVFAQFPVFVSQWTGSAWNAQNFSEFSNAGRLSGFSANGLNFIAAEYLHPPLQQDSLDAGQLFLYTPAGLTVLTDSLFRDEEFIPIGQLLRGIDYYNNQWIVYGDFKKEGRNGPIYPGLAAIGGLLHEEEFDRSKNILAFHPNPTSDFLILENAAENLPYTIYDTRGHWVQRGSVSAKIDVRSLPAGLYIFEVSEMDSQHRQQFIKAD
jgi:hypothetical protein